MREILPFAAFAFFAALIWARGGHARRRSLRADPPVAGRADAFSRYGFFAAWGIGLVGIVAHVGALVALTGVLLLAIGVVLALNLGGAHDLYSERQRRWRRRPDPTLPYAPYLLLLIGGCWLGIGLGQMLSG